MNKFVVKVVYREAGVTEFLSDFIEHREEWQTSPNNNDARMYDTRALADDVKTKLEKIPSFIKYKPEVHVIEVSPIIVWREVTNIDANA